MLNKSIKRVSTKIAAFLISILFLVSSLYPGTSLFSVATNAMPQDYKGLYVDGLNLYDGNKVKFKPIGVNTLFMYQDWGGAKSIPNIAKTKSNVVRIFWHDDEVNVPLSVLDGAIKKAVDGKLIPIVGLWDATGKWDQIDVCVNYWLKPTVIAMVKKYENYFILNIANEAGADVDKTIWKDKYIEIIGKLRAAGYRVPLLVDTAGWGRDPSYILECGNAVADSDQLKNTFFSWHPWNSVQPRSLYTNTIVAVKDLNLCMIIGEFSQFGATNTKPIDWKAIIEESNIYDIGWVVWSWCINTSAGVPDQHSIVNNFLFETPTTYGAEVISEIAKVAQKASVFSGFYTPEPTLSPTPTPTLSPTLSPTPTPSLSPTLSPTATPPSTPSPTTVTTTNPTEVPVTPDPPKINFVTDKSKEISGTAPFGTKISIAIGKNKFNAVTVSGKWKITIKNPFKAGTKICAISSVGNFNSMVRSIFVIPAAPNILKPKIGATKIFGTCTANAIVYLVIKTKTYSAKANSKGTFSIKVSVLKKGMKLSLKCKVSGQVSKVRSFLLQ